MSDLDIEKVEGLVRQLTLRESCEEKPSRAPELDVRCSGHCCESFTMPQSPERIWEMYKDWQSRGGASGRLWPQLNDIHIIAPMLIYLGMVDVDPADGMKLAEPIHRYTCKHYDKETNGCSIYEFRPQMCRDYPYGSRCRYEGCTMRPNGNERYLSAGISLGHIGESLRSKKKEHFPGVLKEKIEEIMEMMDAEESYDKQEER